MTIRPFSDISDLDREVVTAKHDAENGDATPLTALPDHNNAEVEFHADWLNVRPILPSGTTDLLQEPDSSRLFAFDNQTPFSQA